MNTRLQTKQQAQIKFWQFKIEKEAEKELEFIDLTNEVTDKVTESDINDGTVLIYVRHTTAAIRINENEPLLLRDMSRFLEQAAPRTGNYRHNDFTVRTANMTEDECPNGHAHCQHLLLGASETIPVVEGKMALGKWQRIFLVELDRPRKREVLVQIQGW